MRRLSIALAVLTLCGTAYASEGDETVGNRTLACQVAVSPWAASCFVETPLYVAGPFELAIGVDARASAESYVTGYLLAGWYAPTWSAWVEIAVPDIVPPIGRSPPVRGGFTVRF